MYNLYSITGYPDPPGTMEEEEEEEEEQEEDYENMAPPYKDLPPKPGTMEEEEEEEDDYENSTPPYKDLPPKPGKWTFWSVMWGNTGNRIFRGHWLGIVDTQLVSSLPSPCRAPWNPHPARRIY
ncbi:C-type lectin domain family 17, member A-like isoform X1 [Piliocolobus tephrosceles]|uniref:C-type lectin domain family 17, member A-like isoform X1 n=1 Tax=Piliocolobus tephrosceles TaxID=591936 RepID=UPI000E6AEFCC|nr:C-type lectin domain family 17, member A-like isoform X1 [Piliocolobus tephrosceles]